MVIHSRPKTHGLVIEWAARYDVLAWLLTKGRENQLRERMLSLAGLGPGHHVLDVGCGTGTLAIAAARRVGISGVVHGIDASPPMIARARRKAAKASVAVDFDVAVAEALPFPGHQFDIVLSTLMLHHLPRKTRQQCAMEIARILKIGGRVLAVDFGRGHRRGFMSHIHRHGHVDIKDIVALLEDAGLTVIDNGAVGMNNLHFALAENSKNMRSPDRQGA